MLDTVGPLPYTTINQFLDAGFPRGALNYWKSSFLTALTDDAIDTIIECYAQVPSPMSAIAVERWQGAATRVGVGDTRAAGEIVTQRLSGAIRLTPSATLRGRARATRP